MHRPRTSSARPVQVQCTTRSRGPRRHVSGDVEDRPHTNAEPGPDAAADAEWRLSADPNVGAALDWLDRHTGWEPGTSRRRVASRLARLDARDLHDRGSRRQRVDRRRIAQALGEYYGDRTRSHGRYSARVDRGSDIMTSVLTSPDWLDLNCP